MSISEVHAKTILRRYKGVDSWFLSSAGMNLYRGCPHRCAYCDGRAERYQVEGSFHGDLVVKVNAPELLKRELDPARRRKPFTGAFFFLGGGVGDSYNHLEEHYGLTRQALELLHTFEHPVHILTKSTLVLRDEALLGAMARRSRAVVSMSFSTLDDRVAAHFEPGVAPPSYRLSILAHLKAAGIPAGMFLMPLIPGVSDSEPALHQAFQAACEAGLDFAVASGMTLKTGRQRDHFMGELKAYAPSLVPLYGRMYGEDKWGSPHGPEAHEKAALLRSVGAGYPIAKRIPAALFPPTLPRHLRVQVALEQVVQLTRGQATGVNYQESLRRVRSLGEKEEAIPLERLLADLDPDVKDMLLDIGKGSTNDTYTHILCG